MRQGCAMTIDAMRCRRHRTASDVATTEANAGVSPSLWTVATAPVSRL